MATIREKRPGVFEVREYVGRDRNGRPKQVSRIVRGTLKDARRLASELTVKPSSPEASSTTLGELPRRSVDPDRHLVVRAALTLAVRWGWVPANAAAGVRLGSARPAGAPSMRCGRWPRSTARANRTSCSAAARGSTSCREAHAGHRHSSVPRCGPEARDAQRGAATRGAVGAQASVRVISPC